ncbi:hypothetical protein CPB86DRAFT_711940, partial [Serendipita vermifera]
MNTVDEIGLRLLVLGQIAPHQLSFFRTNDLSTDGGDIRALSQLHIIREFMNRTGFSKKMDPPPLPCQYFDMIGGAGTGGLIAILLGVLRMSPDEAERTFTYIWRYAFQEQ